MWNDETRAKIGDAFTTHQILTHFDRLADSDPSLAASLFHEDDDAAEKLHAHNEKLHESLKRKIEAAKKFWDSSMKSRTGSKPSSNDSGRRSAGFSREDNQKVAAILRGEKF